MLGRCINSPVEIQSLRNKANWNKIPLLNHTPPQLLDDGSVVRFRGMIQDMLDPEIYLEKATIRNKSIERSISCKYKESLDLLPGDNINYSCPSNVYGERRTFVVVSIPALNNWANSIEQKYNQNTLCNDGESRFNDNLIINPKRAKLEAKEICQLHPNENANSSNKLLCTEDELNCIKTNPQLNEQYLINSPIKERPCMVCMIMIYDDTEAYSLNTLIDVVGYLSVGSLNSEYTADEFRSAEIECLHYEEVNKPSHIHIQRLHAVVVNVLPHANPLLDERFLNTEFKIEENEINMVSVQHELRKLLSLCLFNDDLGADYLLLNLISNIYRRTETLCIGKFTLNICNLPQNVNLEYTSMLYQVLEMLLTASHYLPMTLDNMNTINFIPIKNYESNKLVSGLLQLAPQTHLILDETKMQDGSLNENGVLGLQHLKHLITHQQIMCNFKFYNINYDTDIPVLILSEGASLLPSDFAVPLHPDIESVKILSERFKAIHHFLQQNNRLDSFRKFLTKARISSFHISSSSIEFIQNDFVEMRKYNIITSTDDFHSLLVVHRLLSISRGNLEFDRDLWIVAKNMETERRRRLQSMPSARNRKNI